MTGKLLSFLISAVIFAVTFTIGAFAIDIYIDDEKVQYDYDSGAPFIKENRTMVPLRRTMESYGAEVRWDDKMKTAVVVLHETTVCCPIGENNIYVNGTKIENETGAEIVNGRTYLPIRAVLEAFGANVGYDGNVLIERPEQYRLIKSIESESGIRDYYWNEWSNAIQLENNRRYTEAIAAFKALIPTMLKKEGALNSAIAYNHLGLCYEKTGRGDLAAVCFEREGELWEEAGMHQDSIVAYRKAKHSRSTLQMFATTTNADYDVRRFTEGDFVPDTGILTGITMYSNYYEYLDFISEKTGKLPGAGLIYCRPDEGITPYISVFTKSAANDTVVQLGLQPYDVADLASITVEDPRYMQIAWDLYGTGAKTYIRFACEMNDTTSAIFTQDYELYKEKFRIVADIFHKYAPNCVMVWSPNSVPEDTMELYYPGDKWVDIVGISAYAAYMPETDPLEQGVDRSRFASLLDKIVSLYGYKKPIMISECGASYRDPATGYDITEYASRQIYEFMTYLPIKYPQVSSMFLFETVDSAGVRKFDFTNNTYMKAATEPWSSDRYLSDYKDSTDKFSFELSNNASVPAEYIQLHSFVKTLYDEYSYVVYRINGKDAGISYEIPYTVNVDFSSYEGQTINLTCLAFDAEEKICTSKSIDVYVKGEAYEDAATGDEAWADPWEELPPAEAIPDDDETWGDSWEESPPTEVIPDDDEAWGDSWEESPPAEAIPDDDEAWADPWEELPPAEAIPDDDEAWEDFYGEIPAYEIISRMYNIKSPDFPVNIFTVDLVDEWECSFYLGLDDSSKILSAAVSEAIVGAVPYSLVVVRADPYYNPTDIAYEMMRGMDPEKWVCVGTDDLGVGVIGEYICICMTSSDYADSYTAENALDTFIAVTENIGD